MQALRINTLSKLTYADALRFHALVGDVFPGISPPEISFGELEAAVKARKGYHSAPPQQLYNFARVTFQSGFFAGYHVSLSYPVKAHTQNRAISGCY